MSRLTVIALAQHGEQVRHGEERNTALARAVVIGGLFATPTTLLAVPYLFAVLRKRNEGEPAHGVFEEGLP